MQERRHGLKNYQNRQVFTNTWKTILGQFFRLPKTGGLELKIKI
jgi:hypothetical protein